LLIREARENDAEGFSRAYEASWNAAMEPLIGRTLGEIVAFEERVTRFRKDMSAPAPGTQVLVAAREHEIVGLAVCRVEDGAGEVQALYLVPSEWGSGTSDRLHKAALDGLRSLGAVDATLWVVEGNQRARRFYERNGWRADGEAKPAPFDLTELRYRRDL
jgi:GNAT superfamily N-acetyltransferase